MIKLTAMSKSVNNVLLRHVSKNVFTVDPLFLFEVTSTKGPATSYLSLALRKILPFDVLRSAVVPAKR